MNTYWKSALAAALSGGTAALAQGGWSGHWSQETVVVFVVGALTGLLAYLQRSPREEK